MSSSRQFRNYSARSTRIMDTVAPPPWDLTGSGYIFLYKFPREFVLSQGFVPLEWENRFIGGFGAVMIVDYYTSDVGPYRELLFIPGLFQHPFGKRYSITKIYVSSIESVVNGQENWGIPKELADFHFSNRLNGEERVIVKRDGQVFFDATLKSSGLRLPVNSRLIPLNLSLGQEYGERSYVTRPHASGWVGLGGFKQVQVDERYFPNISAQRPLLAARAVDFKMTFPVPQIHTK
ncbi:MAG: acetoacetate decarboxylase family protein [bacterium]|nr:acetoacetate decarboxylase family protein [bacterium]